MENVLSHPNEVSPLDALWVLYKSQKKRVQKAFRQRILSEEDRANSDTLSESFAAYAAKARQEFREGKTLSFNSAADAQRWMDEL